MMALNLVAAAIILARGLAALNHMCHSTALAIRITWVMVTAGAAAVLLLSTAPAWPDVALHCGIAALVCTSRRNPPFLKAQLCT